MINCGAGHIFLNLYIFVNIKAQTVKIKYFKQAILYITIIFLTGSCISYRQMHILYKDGESSNIEHSKDTVSTYRLQPDDLININVKSTVDGNVELLSKSFDVTPGSNNNTDIAVYAKGYLIDKDGNVDIPFIKKVKLSGLTPFEAEALIYKELSEYLNHITVTLRLMSYRITYLGEFVKQGIQVVYTPKLNILQAIALGGSFTDYANRKNVCIYRKGENGTVTKIEFDITRKDIFDKSYYIVQPNDVIYAPPLKAKIIKVNSSNLALSFSIVSFTLLMINYLKR